MKRRFFARAPAGQEQVFKMVTQTYQGFYSFDGKLYKSDIIRACMRPKVRAIGKLTAKHIRESLDKDGNKNIQVNPEAHIKFLLEEPNPLMTGQDLQEKMAAQLILNNNCFALIIRNGNGIPMQIYPIPCTSARMTIKNKKYHYRFNFINGDIYEFPLSDVIHIRDDYNRNYYFGDSPAEALKQLMEVVVITDQGVIKAIRNSGIIRWLLKYTNSLKPEHLKRNAKEFAENYLNLETDTFGVAATDSKADAQQITSNDYVPNAAVMDKYKNRIYSFFNTNDEIVQSKADEDTWSTYFESEIEPVELKFQNEWTRKLFTRKQRISGDSIYFEAGNLQHASLKTKLECSAMVDRQAMLPDEWRRLFYYAPLPGGDKPLLRKDTDQKGGGDNE